MSVYRIQGEGLTYNRKALIRCTMNNPGHFMALKENFPVVDSKPVNDTISKVFFERAMIQSSTIDKLKDLWSSFRFSSNRFLRMLGKRLAQHHILLLILSIINLLFMHYSLFNSSNVERQIEFTLYFDNLSVVTSEVLFIFFVLSLLTKMKMRLAAFFTAFLTLLWSFCNVVYARFFFQYISVSAIVESENLFDPFIFKCLVDGIRWSDIYYLGSMLISCFLYKRISESRLGIKEFRCGVFVMIMMLVIDVVAHVSYCVSSPSKRYLSYIKHRISLELLSQQCYSAQPVYANFQRGSIRALGYGLMECFSSTMVLTDGQQNEIETELESLRPFQICAKSHPQIDNVIFILVESYMSFTVNMKVKGQEVTPFLNSLYRDSTVFYNGQMNPNITLGESSDGQFIYLTGLLPLRSEITITKAKRYSYPALPRLLTMKKNIHSQMVIPTSPSMWSQDVMSDRYGIEKLYSTNDYLKPHSMYLSDDQIIDMADSVNKISKQPFFSMVLTFSMHQPYVNEVDSTFNVYESEYSSSLNHYLNACHYTDRQLRIYFDGLKKQGLYDHSLIIITADHHVGSSALELPDSMVDRKLPLFIINGGDAMSVAWTGVCNQLDVFTTILDLLEVDSSWRGLGHSLLSPAYKNSLSNKKWQMSEWIIKSGYLDGIDY